ncbi:MAG: hypothetical protein F6K30_18125 [Cyanothece sp. SIO2G6]|nr:hypothetical protein [Cyanothece sp. SIO2G6]
MEVVGDDITATTTGDEDGQGVLLRADTIRLLDGARVLSQSSGSGQAGDMTIEARQFLIRNNLSPGPELTPDDFEGDEFTADNLIRGEFTEREFTGLGTNTNPESTGNGGDIRITVTERLEIVGNDRTPFNADPADPESVLSVVNVPTGIISSAAGSGQSGDIVMDVGEFIMRDRAGIGSGPLLRDSDADDGGSITITADSVRFRNRAGIVTSPLGPGSASDLTLNVAQTLTLERGGSIIADSPATTDGNAGDVFITAEQINLRSGGRIGTSTASAGRGGDLEISADVINVRGRAIAPNNHSDRPLTPSGIFSSALVNSSAPAGDITLEVNTLNIRDGGEISASTAGTESAGDILIQGRDSDADGGAGTIRIMGATDPGLNTQSAISTEARRRAQGDGGTIQLRNIGTLMLQNNGNITARGRGDNNAGNIRIDANIISLNQSNITAQTNRGTGGDIRIDADRMTLNQSNITAQTNSGIGGDINIEANRMSLNQSNITAQTDSGSGGTIGIEANTISLDQRSLITAETATGEGGDVFITTNQLEVSSRSEISVASAEGLAGNVAINANGIVLDSGTIPATTGRNAPDGRPSANVILTGLDNNLVLRNGSLISADASLSDGAESNANAGNIIINAENGFIIASPLGNNDIIATAGEGDGGNITLTALRIFDLDERSGTRETLINNDTNDISASSLLGNDGVISIEDLGIDPVQAAADLPADTAPPPLDQGCQPGMDGRGRFVNTEQGGIPPSLDDPLASGRGWEDVQPIAPVPTTSASEPGSPETVLLDAIAEAEGWHLNEQGQVILMTVETARSVVFSCSAQSEE